MKETLQIKLKCTLGAQCVNCSLSYQRNLIEWFVRRVHEYSQWAIKCIYEIQFHSCSFNIIWHFCSDLQHISQHHLVFLYLQLSLEEIHCIVSLHLALCCSVHSPVANQNKFCFYTDFTFFYLAKMTNNSVDAVFVNWEVCKIQWKNKKIFFKGQWICLTCQI